MKIMTAVILLAAALLFLLASYLHDSAHRYYVIVGAAGSGGSQESAGETEIRGYLVDHRTGKVWEVRGSFEKPLVRTPCPDFSKETKNGCEMPR